MKTRQNISKKHNLSRADSNPYLDKYSLKPIQNSTANYDLKRKSMLSKQATNYHLHISADKRHDRVLHQHIKTNTLILSMEIQMKTSALIRRERRRGLPAEIHARNQMLLEHLGLVHHVARKQMQKGPEEYDDLLQESCLGAIAAVEHFDKQKGFRPSSYIVSRAIGQIKHYRRDRSQCIRVPWRQKDLVSKGLRLQQKRKSDSLPLLSDKDLADHLGVTTKRWLDCQQAVEEAKTISLDQGVLSKEAEGINSFAETIQSDNQPIDSQWIWLQTILLELDPQERKILLAHYRDGVSYNKIAKEVRMNRQQVMTKIQKMLKNLKKLACLDSPTR